jgi:DNA-directed RNA polymerase subunit RPC12/RpoP
MSRRKRKPATIPPLRTGPMRGTAHFRQIADIRGWKLADDERIAAALPVPDPEWEGWKQGNRTAALKLHCSRCGARLRNKDGYLLEASVAVYCERCSERLGH